MTVIRPIRESDFHAFQKFAMTAGAGVTSLPRDPALLKEKIRRSIASFHTQDPHREGLYVFVLEDIATGELGGTCAIDAKTQGSEDGYLFRVEELLPTRLNFPTPKHMRILQPIQLKNYASEIGGLYLLPKYRSGGLGRLLSLSRFLFIATFRERLHPIIIAEMRGRIAKNGHSPFWDAVGRHFVDLPFNRILAEVAHDHSLIPKIMPQFPIYVSMMPLAAQRCIGKTHKNTAAALSMLMAEGFQPTGEVDILAAGPRLATPASQIRTVAESRVAVVASIQSQPITGPSYLMSNENINFRCTYGTLIQHPDGTTITLHRDTAAILHVHEGDPIRYVVPPTRQHLQGT